MHRRDVGEPAAVVVAEVVQVEDDRRAAVRAPAASTPGDGMSAVGQQHVGPEPVEHLLGQVEEHARPRAGRAPVGPAGGRGQHRDADAVELRSTTSAVPPRPSDAVQPPGRAVEPRIASSSSTVVSRW